MSEPKCSKCDKDATYDIPEPLCDFHWGDWFNYGADATEREEILRILQERIDVLRVLLKAGAPEENE